MAYSHLQNEEEEEEAASKDSESRSLYVSIQEKNPTAFIISFS